MEGSSYRKDIIPPSALKGDTGSSNMTRPFSRGSGLLCLIRWGNHLALWAKPNKVFLYLPKLGIFHIGGVSMIGRHVKSSPTVEESPAKDVGPKEAPERSDHEIDRIGPPS